jgi:hypothetical protein
MNELDRHNDDKGQGDKLLRGSTGVPVDDGSQAFKNHIQSRLDASYDKSNRVSREELFKVLGNDRQSRVV